MINLFWRLVAQLLARPAIADWLITRAKRTPYLHIMSADGAEMYMGRWWLFNPYSRETHKPALWWFPWSFRIHHILRLCICEPNMPREIDPSDVFCYDLPEDGEIRGEQVVAAIDLLNEVIRQSEPLSWSEGKVVASLSQSLIDEIVAARRAA
jgi:hypothetical protein